MADWIISHFPKHDCYIEPCFGAGSILLNKSRSRVETVNDLDGNVVNFFRTLRDQKKELVEKIRLTPWAKVEATLPVEGNSVERARRFWAQCWMTIAQKQSTRPAVSRGYTFGTCKQKGTNPMNPKQEEKLKLAEVRIGKPVASRNYLMIGEYDENTNRITIRCECGGWAGLEALTNRGWPSISPSGFHPQYPDT